ncbi:hypothetical protein BTO06_05130 [Tenacibaculum sp. SZ-18]|uniref:hypothetical protein n=1 Tax=Tenacibaculum sp. SZ-18 TaxID=754423 RepID=UPI000C2D4AF4|nr:hypothetical protein [Tenacibaculum sp. SZ-18]AUC14566.1 hypothetical protein BTO06_05130 [Tenacibaculum sp. SZ-18]
MFKNLNLQEILSLAYIILVVIGVISESIFYGVLGVHYLEYTSILDALISPFSLITSDLRVFIIVVLVMLFYYLYIRMFLPWIFKKTKKTKSLESIKSKKTLYFALLLALLVIFPSMRIGMSVSYKQKLKDKKFKNDHTLVFKSGEVLNVKKIGQNTSYIFYVQEDDTELTVTPVLDQIKQIKRIPKKD